MKTSKPFTEVPVDQIKGQFAVMRESGRRMHFCHLHADVLDAMTEAERLNAERGERYWVTKVIARVGYA